MKFEASLDTLAKVASMTIVVVDIVLGLLAFKDYLGGHETASIRLEFLTPFLALGGISLLCFLFAPISYTLTEKELIINRPLLSRKVDLTELIRIRKVSKEEMSGTIRTLGVGGLFGYYGKFANDLFGEMNYYVTQRKNYLVLITKEKDVLVLSPNDETLFDRLNEITNHNTNYKNRA